MPRWAETRIWDEDDDLDPVDPILDRFPGPVTITDSMRRRIAVCAGVTLFNGVFAGVSWRAWDWNGDWALGQAMGFAFAAIICVAVELRVLAALFVELGSLTLDAEGFEVRTLATRFRRSWKDVDGFEAERFGRMWRVSYINRRPAGDTMRAFQWIFGNREALIYTYGYGRRDLARLLTQWRERALALSR